MTEDGPFEIEEIVHKPTTARSVSRDGSVQATSSNSQVAICAVFFIAFFEVCIRTTVVGSHSSETLRTKRVHIPISICLRNPSNRPLRHVCLDVT